MDDVIQIKCPNDGAILSIKNQMGIEKMKVTCPICKQSRPFTEYKKYVPKAVECTEYPGQGEEHTSYGGEIENIPQSNLILGKLVETSTNNSYQLKPGRTVIGRKSPASHADFQIETGDSRRMSRDHLVIEVAKVAGKGYVHQVKLFKEKCNDTFVNQAKLEYGDCIILHHGDLLRLPDANIRFEIPDDEGTVF